MNYDEGIIKLHKSFVDKSKEAFTASESVDYFLRSLTAGTHSHNVMSEARIMITAMANAYRDCATAISKEFDNIIR